MEDQVAGSEAAKNPRQGGSGSERSEAVRSRWTPKADQILILESIFNSGMVNPPKEETVRIRKLLEKFGPVGDANVFYWFQNRRSRSRRRQRQIQATLLTTPTDHQPQSIHQASSSTTAATMPTHHYDNNSSFASSCLFGTGEDDHLSQQMDLEDIDQTSILGPDFCQPSSGSMTVFINGVATQVPRGAFDMRAMFGAVMLVHSSGIPVPMNEYGMSLLQMGESYFLLQHSHSNTYSDSNLGVVEDTLHRMASSFGTVGRGWLHLPPYIYNSSQSSL